MIPINGRGGSRAFPSENRSKPSPEWNHYRVVCNNGDISLAVNGKVVTQGRRRGRARVHCLESEGSPVQFRNMSLKNCRPLAQKPKKPRTPLTDFGVCTPV